MWSIVATPCTTGSHTGKQLLILLTVQLRTACWFLFGSITFFFLRDSDMSLSQTSSGELDEFSGLLPSVSPLDVLTVMPPLSKQSFRAAPLWDFDDIYRLSPNPRLTVRQSLTFHFKVLPSRYSNHQDKNMIIMHYSTKWMWYDLSYSLIVGLCFFWNSQCGIVSYSVFSRGYNAVLMNSYRC